MDTNYHPSTIHAIIHKAACALGLATAMLVGVSAVFASSNRISATGELKSWCEKSACISHPSGFQDAALVVYADKGKEATQLVAQLFRPSPLRFLDMPTPDVQLRPRPPGLPASKVKGSKK